jgi:hypothetical protein
MNVGISAGIPASIAGAPAAQIAGSEVDRAKGETAAQRRAQTSEIKAEQAAGIGATDGEDHTTSDRDADGRRMWELPHKANQAPQDTDTATAEPIEHHSLDPTGTRGGLLDLSG